MDLQVRLQKIFEIEELVMSSFFLTKEQGGNLEIWGYFFCMKFDFL